MAERDIMREIMDIVGGGLSCDSSLSRLVVACSLHYLTANIVTYPEVCLSTYIQTCHARHSTLSRAPRQVPPCSQLATN
jgi:hypothetical protein